MERYTLKDLGFHGFDIIDNHTDGGKRICHHSTREMAEAELRRLGAKPGETVALPVSPDAMLRGPAGGVRAKVAAMTDKAFLEGMLALERAGSNRQVVTVAIESRLAALD